MSTVGNAFYICSLLHLFKAKWKFIGYNKLCISVWLIFFLYN